MSTRRLEPAPDIDDTVGRLKREGGAFALATVVRTLSMTAAKPGAKAIIDRHGEVIEGWIGGGCARGAVRKAAIEAIADGEPRYVSVHPEEVLAEQGMDPGPDVDGRWVAMNLCPSKGSMEVFIEPYLANPELLVVGSSPVALSLRRLAPLFDFGVATVGHDDEAGRTYPSWEELPAVHGQRYIVIATQGVGDHRALSAALGVQAVRIGFVGSRRKVAHLKGRLADEGHDEAALVRVKGPAGLDIGAVTPHEIALSILAELVAIRRSRPRDP